MRNLLLAGIWAGAVTIASVYVSSSADGLSLFSRDPTLQGIVYVKTRPINVPRISDGRIQGYVVAQFVFTMDAKARRSLSVPMEVFVVDEAFRAIYDDEAIEFTNLQKTDLEGLTSALTARVNARLEADFLKETLVEQFDYVPYEAMKQYSTGAGGQASAG